MWPFRKEAVRADPLGTGGGDAQPEYAHYRVLRDERGEPCVLGHGAMGITYKAEDTSLRVPVALKVISPLIAETPGAREFFLTEARGAASLRHRNAAAVHHLGVNKEGDLFFAMEFIAGETLDALIKRQHRLDVPLALDIAQQTACALAAAQGRRLIHRDIKPANLMLSDEGDGTLVVKVIDFGLCKTIQPHQPANGSTPGGVPREPQFLGTPHYASPEQIRGEASLDGRADFYSLGATLWTMLTGRPVFHGSLSSIRQRHLDELPPYEDLPAEVSPPVRGLLASLLSKDPSGRPQTALELIDRIEAAGYDHRGAEADPRRHWKTQGCVPLVGSVLAHNYHLEALAGESDGSGNDPIFRAEDIAGGRRVAVQLLDRHQPLEVVRSNVERLATLPHPNLVQNHVFSSCRGQPFIVSEWLDGFPLSEVLRARTGNLRPSEVLRLIRQAAEAWAHTHEHQLGRLKLRPDTIHVHFGDDTLEKLSRRDLLATPMAQWPPFTLKLQVKTHFPAETGPIEARAAVSEAIRGLGDLTAELLGSSDDSTHALGAETSGGAHGASRMPPAVREVIEQTVNDSLAFGSVAAFVGTLADAFQTDAQWFQGSLAPATLGGNLALS